MHYLLYELTSVDTCAMEFNGIKAMYVYAFLVTVAFVNGEDYFDCNEEKQPPIIVNDDARYITSPSFPRHYPNSCRCQSSFNTELAGHVLHVEVVHMQLANWNGSCLDNVTAFDGSGSDDKVLTRWCGSDTHILSTSGPRLVLEFSSDASLSGVGFAFNVWSAPSMETSCQDNHDEVISVDKHPVHVSLDLVNMIPTIGSSSCAYTFQAVKDSDVISLTTSALQTFVRRYSIDIYDGQSTSSPQLMSWSPSNKPFSDVTSSGTHMTIVFEDDGLERTDAALPDVRGAEPDEWAGPNIGSIRVVAAPQQEICNDVITREVTSLSSVFSLPTALDANGQECPLMLISRDHGQTLRLDVIGDVEDDVVNAINVTEVSIDGEALTLTRKYNTWTFRSSGPVVYIQGNSSQLAGRTVRLRVLTLDPYSNGKVMKVTAVSTRSSNLHLQNLHSNAYVVYMITADRKDNIVHLNMTSSVDDVITSNCDQVKVDFFDGTLDGEPIQSWCPGAPNNTVKSPNRTLYFTVYSNETDPNLSISGSYFSLKEGSLCQRWREDIRAEPKKKGFITSPNFPGKYSINNDCVWRIAAPRINFVVVAEVIWSDLPDDCSDLVYVVNNTHPSDKTLFRICGQDQMSFRTSGPTLLLHFVSDSQGNHGGFKISYTTEHKSRGKKLTDGPPVGIIAGACIALFVVGGVIYVIVHVYRKRHKMAKKLKESTL